MDDDDIDFYCADDELDALDDADEFDDFDGYDDVDVEDENSDGSEENKVSEAEYKGFMDGEFDSRYRNVRYMGFGSSVDDNEMSDAEREAYENGYENGFDMGEM